MDFSKLSSNDKLAAVAAAVTVVAGAVAAGTYGHYGITWLAILLAVAMLAVIFLPQISAGTNLPGSKGSLMLIAGGIAAVAMALSFLTNITFTFNRFGFPDALYLVAVAASLAMGWAGWLAFQAEGGKFTLGMSSGKPDSAAPAEPAASAETAAPAEQAAPAEPAAPPPSAEPAAPPPPAAPPAPGEPAAGQMEGGEEADDRMV